MSNSEIIRYSQQNDSAIHETRIVHIVLCDAICDTRREETEHHRNKGVQSREGVHSQAPSPQRPGSEMDLAATESSKNHQTDGDKVGGKV